MTVEQSSRYLCTPQSRHTGASLRVTVFFYGQISSGSGSGGCIKQMGVTHMVRIGFDNDRYLRLQSEQIAGRIQEFGGKLYLEFGGKLFDDYHASRVLPGLSLIHI